MSEPDDRIEGLYATGYPLQLNIWWFFRAVPGRTRGNIYNYNYWACGWCGWYPGTSELPQVKCGSCKQMIMTTRKDAFVAIRPYIYNNSFRGHDLHVLDRDAWSPLTIEKLRMRTLEKLLKEVIVSKVTEIVYNIGEVAGFLRDLQEEKFPNCERWDESDCNCHHCRLDHFARIAEKAHREAKAWTEPITAALPSPPSPESPASSSGPEPPSQP